jgi:hypothetical protein
MEGERKRRGMGQDKTLLGQPMPFQVVAGNLELLAGVRGNGEYFWAPEVGTIFGLTRFFAALIAELELLRERGGGEDGK